MMTSIQQMQSNDLTSSFIRPPHLLNNDLQSQLHMLYALTQQQLSSDSKIKRVKKSMPPPNDPPSQVPFISATDSRSNSTSDREVIKVVTTAGPQSVDKEFLAQLLSRKDVIPARKRRDFIPNDMKDNHYWERRRKNNLAAKRSREKRRFNDIVLETKVVELTNENESLKAKLHLMLSRVNMKEMDMENLFEEEQRLGHICLKPATAASILFSQQTSDDDDDDNSNHYDQHSFPHTQSTGNNNAIDLSRTEVKTGNLLATIPNESPSPITPSPSPPNESLLQILANQMLQTKQPESGGRLLTIASPTESKPSTLKRNINQLQQDEAAMALLSLNTPTEQQTAIQSVCQSVINGLLRKPNPLKTTIDYQQQIQGENFHHQQNDINSLAQWKTLMNYFSMPSLQQQQQQQQNESRGEMMPLKLRMKMLNAKI